MLNIEIGLGFAVELFVIIFSFLCWLVAITETPTVSAVNTQNQTVCEQEEETNLNATPIAKSTDSFTQDYSQHYLDNVDVIVDNLSLNETRKIASQLKSLKIINSEVKLSGKGIGKDFLIELIKSEVSKHREAIASVLHNILGKTN